MTNLLQLRVRGGEHIAELADGTLFSQGNSWFVGANIPGKNRVFLLYANTAQAYRQKCAEAAANGYEGFLLQWEREKS